MQIIVTQFVIFARGGEFIHKQNTKNDYCDIE